MVEFPPSEITTKAPGMSFRFHFGRQRPGASAARRWAHCISAMPENVSFGIGRLRNRARRTQC